MPVPFLLTGVPMLEKNSEHYKAKIAFKKIIKMKKIRTKKYIELENIISKSSFHSCNYAHNVLKGRFEKGEESIGKDLKICYSYAKFVIKGQLPDDLHCIMMANAIMANVWANAYFIHLKMLEEMGFLTKHK